MFDQQPASKRHGFTLIELMIVVVVIIVIAAISIPLLIRQRMASNETSAIAALRTISTSQAVFRNSTTRDDNLDGIGDYGTLAELGASPAPGTPGLIDRVLADGIKSGYEFEIEVFPGTDADPEPRFSAFAFPIAYNRSGVRNFYVDQENVIRFTIGEANAGSLGPASPPVGG